MKYSNDRDDLDENAVDLDREILAVIRHIPGSDSHEIVLNDEVTWTATPIGNNFEFVNVDREITTTAQWARVKPRAKSKREKFCKFGIYTIAVSRIVKHFIL